MKISIRILNTLLFLCALPVFASASEGGGNDPNGDPGCHYDDQRHYHVELNTGSPYGLNDKGSYVGTRNTVSGVTGYYQPGSWNRGEFSGVGSLIMLRPVGTGLVAPVANSSKEVTARAINNESTPAVVGYGKVSFSLSGGNQIVQRAFFWRPSSVTITSGAAVPPSVSDPISRGFPLSSDPTYTLGQIGTPAVAADLRSTFALKISNPLLDPVTGAATGNRIVVGIQAPASVQTPDYFPETGRPGVLAGGRAIYWNLGSTVSGAFPSPNYITGMDSKDSEARDVNSVGTIVGNYVTGGNYQAFVTTYPYTTVELLPQMSSGGYDSTFAVAVNDFGTKAAPLAGEGPGQVFGYAYKASGGKVDAVVWTKDATGWHVTNLLNPAGSARSWVSAAGSRGVVTGIKNGAAFILRDGRDPIMVADAAKSYSRGGAPTLLNYNSIRAMNNNGDVIAGAGLQFHLMRPTYYDLVELKAPTRTTVGEPLPGIAEHSPVAVAVSIDGQFAVGYSRWCRKVSTASADYPDCVPLTNGRFDPTVGNEHALFWKINTTSSDAYDVDTSDALSLPTDLSQNGDYIGGASGSKTSRLATKWHVDWSTGAPTFTPELLSDFPANASLAALSNDMTGTGFVTLDAINVGKDAFISGSDLDSMLVRIGGTTTQRSKTAGGRIQVTISEVSVLGEAIGLIGSAPTYWMNLNSAATLSASGSSMPYGISIPRTEPCGTVKNATSCQNKRKLIVGTGSGGSTALVWKTTNGTTFGSPVNASLTVNSSPVTSTLARVNGYGQAVGAAQVPMKWALINTGTTTQSSMLLYDAFKQTNATSQMSFAMPPDSGFMFLADGKDIDFNGGIVGSGTKIDGTTSAYYIRPPSEDDPVCWPDYGNTFPVPG